MTVCSPSIEIKQCDWQTTKAKLRAIRSEVFIEEQNVPVELEWDDKDETATHFLVTLDDTPIGCARIIDITPSDAGIHQAAIGRMAILKTHRGQGYGLALLDALISYCKQAGFTHIVLAAQCHAIGFYQQLGFEPEGDIFMDAGIEHRRMQLAITH